MTPTIAPGTQLAAICNKGTDQCQVVNSGGFQIGQTVIIGAPAKEEIQVIKAFFFDANSGLSFMIFESPLNYDHPIGVMIALFPAVPTTAAPDSTVVPITTVAPVTTTAVVPSSTAVPGTSTEVPTAVPGTTTEVTFCYKNTDR